MGFKLSNIIIGMIFIGFFVTIIIGFMSNASKQNNLDFDNETISKYDTLEATVSLTDSLRHNESEMKRQSGVFDIIGDWFEQGYNTLRASKAGVDAVDGMMEDAVEDSKLGPVAVALRVTLGAIIAAVIVFIVISTLTKRES